MMGRGVGRRATTSPERRAVNRNGARPVAAQSSVSRSAIAAPDPPAEFKQQLLTTDPKTEDSKGSAGLQDAKQVKMASLIS